MDVTSTLRGARLGAGSERALKALVDFAEDVAAMPAMALARIFGGVPHELRGAHPLCAVPVSYLLATWLAECRPAQECFSELPAPQAKDISGLLAWAKRFDGAAEFIPHGEVIAGTRKPQPGDLAIFNFVHCGLVVTQSNRGIFTCVEGFVDRGLWTMGKRARGVSALHGLIRLVPKE